MTNPNTTTEGGDPFFITGPAILCVSYGRTSGEMFRRIIKAHGGTLPDDVHAVFTNTGKEREETLRFGHEIEIHWGVPIHWAEFRDNEIGFERVSYETASRNGEPFEALIRKKGYVPNRGAPYCSIELKARVTRDYVRATWGWRNWTSFIGLRYDEQLRVIGAIGRNESGKDPWRNAMPLNDAKVVKRDILDAWAKRNFDLGLLNYQGNCTRCWKKSLPKQRRIIRDEQEGQAPADPWWAEMERLTGTTFNLHLSHSELEQQVRDEPMMPLESFDADDDSADEECGFTCVISDADAMDLVA